ncbi:gamma-glutamylcyclotransferase family protein [Aspergillus mulundensis]|uniref:Putative gamma-glutamylcyclotransferase n=1 Tax=Aspergillus mulundensis TaxID=1810919 RepID=A0A3D8QJ89_9EURO|nr:hypothetical protein DSM5745_10453 [Aspergillus mulundensis]RDW61781.1 hypothetical protein DSM5745_10453 [Aspergillus mulundensis]
MSDDRAPPPTPPRPPRPPPPPPPPPETPDSKVSPIVGRTAPTPFLQSTPASSSATPAPTGPYFFYGTLSEPSLLSEILKLDTVPHLRPARITGYAVRMWGAYPALVSVHKQNDDSAFESDGDPDSVVTGFVYRVETVQHAERLALYDARNYRPEPCLITYADAYGDWKELVEERELGWVFRFVGDHHELSHGDLDPGTLADGDGRSPATRTEPNDTITTGEVDGGAGSLSSIMARLGRMQEIDSGGEITAAIGDMRRILRRAIEDVERLASVEGEEREEERR